MNINMVIKTMESQVRLGDGLAFGIQSLPFKKWLHRPADFTGSKPSKHFVGVVGTLLLLALLVACDEGPGSGPGSGTGSAGVRPPDWIMGYWKCDEERARSACYDLIRVDAFAGAQIFRDDEIRSGTSTQNILWISDDVPGVTQSIAGDTYTVVVKTVGLTVTRRWSRTGTGLEYEFLVTGNFESHVKAPFVRWSGDLEE